MGRRNDREASGRWVPTEASSTGIVSEDLCVLVTSDRDGVSEVSRVARLEDVVANRSSKSTSSSSVVRSPNLRKKGSVIETRRVEKCFEKAHHSTDGNTDFHHVVVSDESVAFDDGSFERSGPRSPIYHVDSSKRTSTGSDNSVARDSRSESSEDDDSSVSAIGNDVSLTEIVKHQLKFRFAGMKGKRMLTVTVEAPQAIEIPSAHSPGPTLADQSVVSRLNWFPLLGA